MVNQIKVNNKITKYSKDEDISNQLEDADTLVLREVYV